MLSRAELQAQLEETDRKWGLESLYYFARFNLGYSLMLPTPHKDVCRFAEEIISTHKYGLDLEPRGAFKTSIFSQALPVWLLHKNPNLRILLDSTVLQNSLDNLGVIKRHLESPALQFLYGGMVGNQWTADEITVSKRTIPNLKEPSVRCASPERIQVGPHYDVIIADDLVSVENINTPEARKHIKDHFRLLFSLLEPGGVIFVVGTRWHYEDLYGMIQQDFPEFQCRIKSAESKTGELYFPERLTKDFLEKQKSRLGRDFYNAQYGNDPAPEDEHAAFQKSWFKRYDRLPDQKETKLFGFLTVDPGGKDKGSDEWVIMSEYCDENNFIYFDRILKGNWRTDKAFDNLFMLVDAVKPVTVGFETTAGQKYLYETLQDEMRRRNKFFHVTALTHAFDSKEYRIRRLVPRYQCGSVLHSKQMGDLEEQLRRFPKGKDDIADCAAMILEIAMSPRSKIRKSKEIASIDHLFMLAAMRPNSNTASSGLLGREG